MRVEVYAKVDRLVCATRRCTFCSNVQSLSIEDDCGLLSATIDGPLNAALDRAIAAAEALPELTGQAAVEHVARQTIEEGGD